MTPPRVGVSACLLGQNVRFDGGHKRDSFTAGELGRHFTLVPVCPEVELGMGVPRPPVRLERSPRGVRMVAIASRIDHTDAMNRFAARRASELEALDLSGYVLKKNSPSCGPAGVPIHGRGAARSGRGLFASALHDRMPLLPVVDEGDLADGAGQEHFLERVFAYRRLRDFFKGRWTIGKLVEFHASEKPVFLAHDPGGYAELGRLVARAKSLARNLLSFRYQTRFMNALAKPATASKRGSGPSS
jgi:uncharacterized protein YbbK (DUF523 family)